jgi:hypothetical protein
MKITTTNNQLTVNLNSEREFIKIEDYTGSDIVAIQDAPRKSKILTLTFDNYRMSVTTPEKVSMRSVFATLNRFDDVKAERSNIKKALLELAKKHMRLDEFADKLILEELMFYLAYPIVYEAHSLSAVVETLSKYLDGQFDPLTQFTTRERVAEVYGSAPATLVEAVAKKLYNTPLYRRVVFETKESYDSFANRFETQGDQRFHIRTENRTDEEILDENIKVTKAKGIYRTDVILWNYFQINMSVFKEVEDLKKLFTLDHVVYILNNTLTKQITLSKEIIAFLNEFGTKTKLDLVTHQGNELRDTANQWHAYRTPESVPETLRQFHPEGLTIPKKWKDLTELHDKISKTYNEFKAEANKLPINYTTAEAKLNMKVNDFEIKLPKDTSEIVLYGQALKNCVASYAERACNKQIYILGVYRKDTLKYNIELHKDNQKGIQIVQFKGMRNATPDPDDEKVIREAITNFNTKHKNDLIKLGETYGKY